LWNNAKLAPAAQRGLRHCVQGAVAAGRDYDAGVLSRFLHRLMRDLANLRRVFDAQDFMCAARAIEHAGDGAAGSLCIALA